MINDFSTKRLSHKHLLSRKSKKDIGRKCRWEGALEAKFLHKTAIKSTRIFKCAFHGDSQTFDEFVGKKIGCFQDL